MLSSRFTAHDPKLSFDSFAREDRKSWTGWLEEPLPDWIGPFVGREQWPITFTGTCRQVYATALRPGMTAVDGLSRAVELGNSCRVRQGFGRGSFNRGRGMQRRGTTDRKIGSGKRHGQRIYGRLRECDAK
jgi:hypothetical protein